VSNPPEVTALERTQPGFQSSAGTHSASSSRQRERPGPIDNKPLLEENRADLLKKGLQERQDFEIVSAKVWSLLHRWYQGGPPVKRRAIVLASGAVQVELYGLELKVYRSSSLNLPVMVTESKTTTMKDFKKRMCEEMCLEPEKVRVWDYFNNKKYQAFENTDTRTLEECRILDGNAILMEEANKDGGWPANNNTHDDLYSGGYSLQSDLPTTGRPVQKGAAGLQNLGNTCFMNSSIQCLSNIPALREYFTSDCYKSTLNPSAYKTKGKLAESFAQLLTLLWREDTVSIAPRNFKWQIGQFAERFSGYGQQDSMELIEYVLDGLKEDCNQVQGQKPYVEVKEAEGRPDHVVAKEARESYSKRNNSYIDELFVGFFKSTVKCPEPQCKRESVTFDPFLSVKLPLVSSAEDRMATFNIITVSRRPNANKGIVARHKVMASKSGVAQDLVEAAAKEADLDAKSCVLAELWSKKIHKFFEDSESVDAIRSDDILLLYELEDASAFKMGTNHGIGGATASRCNNIDNQITNDCTDTCGLIVNHRQSRGMNTMNNPDVVGIPMVLTLPRRMTERQLLDTINREIQQCYGHMGNHPWRIFRIPDKWTVVSRDSPVEVHDNEPGAHLTFNQREYLAVEWNEDVQLPQALVQSLQEAEDTGSNGRSGERESEVPLEKCFAMFTEVEQLTKDDGWYCNRCKKHVEAFKQLELYSLPPVLIVQLKRFSYTRWTRERLDTSVRFSHDRLDLTPYTVTSSSTSCSVYDLAAVSKHIGALGGGHYIAYARSSVDGRWYCFDDGLVRGVQLEDVLNDKVGAYVLFYIRRDHRPKNWGPPDT